MKIEVEKIGARYVAMATYEQREIPKAAGFRWDRDRRHWYTTDAAIAAKLSDSDAILAEARAKTEAREAKIEESRAAAADVELPCPDGLAYLPYQRAGIATAINRPNVLFGDEMGLGKTIQAIGVINADESIKRVLVICPASLRLNWAREMRKWLTRDMQSIIVQGSEPPMDGFPVTIINYDILAKHVAWLQQTQWDLVIVDEAHYLKSKGAKRSQAVFGIDEYTAKKQKCEPTPGIRGRRRVALTGTPIPNRPVEGYGLFHWLAPDEFRSFFGYAKQFCDARNNGHGWDFSGSSNLSQLQDKLRGSIMIRRLKQDVLTELPAKRRAIVEFPANGASGAVAREMQAWERQESDIEALRVKAELAKAGTREEYEASVAALRQATQAAFTELSKLRHETAMATVPYAVQHILQCLADEQKIVVMAHHKDVVQAIMDALAEEKIEAVSLTGETPMQTRQDNVDRFQREPSCRVFVGNIQAAGVGITLTAASHVIFAELDWVPGNMTQAEDRCHRIGQTDSVLVQHLVLEGSLSARMAKVLIDKQEVIDRALDRKEEAPVEEPATPARDRAATEGVSRDKLGEIAEKLTPENIAAIHVGLKILAGFDIDHASSLNGIGFSKMDVQIGHDLAERGALTPRQAALGSKLVNRYRRQLPEEIVEAAKVE